MLFETLNFGLRIQTTLETPERCVKDTNRRERWIETASSPEERPPSLSSPAVTAPYHITDAYPSLPSLVFPSLLFLKAPAHNPLPAFLHISYTFLFSWCFESEICNSQRRATLCPSKHLLKRSSAITHRKTWEEAPRVLFHSPAYNNHQCRCTVPHVPSPLGKHLFGKPEGGSVFFLCLYNTEVLICG